MTKAKDPDLTQEADEVLNRVDAFMRRRRTTSAQDPGDDDIPLLTDIVPDAPAEFQAPAHPPQASPAPRAAAPVAPVPAPAPASFSKGPTQEEIAAQVARRVEEALAEHRVNLAIALDDWLNFDLPRLVSQEMEGVADRIVSRAGDELRRVLHAVPPPGDQ